MDFLIDEDGVVRVMLQAKGGPAARKAAIARLRRSVANAEIMRLTRE